MRGRGMMYEWVNSRIRCGCGMRMRLRKEGMDGVVSRRGQEQIKEFQSSSSFFVVISRMCQSTITEAEKMGRRAEQESSL